MREGKEMKHKGPAGQKVGVSPFQLSGGRAGQGKEGFVFFDTEVGHVEKLRNFLNFIDDHPGIFFIHPLDLGEKRSGIFGKFFLFIGVEKVDIKVRDRGKFLAEPSGFAGPPSPE